MTDEPPIETLLERIARMYEDELQGADLRHDRGDHQAHKLLLSPAGSSHVTEIGPGFETEEEFRAFLRGLEWNPDDLRRKAKP